MSRNQRIGLLLAAAAVAVVAIVVAVASGGDNEGDQAAQTTTQAEPGGGNANGNDNTEQPHETLAQNQEFDRIRIKGGQVVGGPPNITVTKGQRVRIVVSSDAPDDIHLHGYDIEKPVEPGQPAQLNFVADVEGIFEIESHVAEDAGRDPLVGKLTVEPG